MAKRRTKLETVHVPAEMAPLFREAERVVSEYFKQQNADPRHGTIEICGERYVLVRAASLSVEFFELVRDLYGEGKRAEADDFSRNILFDLAHAIGSSDARNFHAKMGLDDPIARLSAGPVHFAHTGWAFVDISPESKTGDADEYDFLYEHPSSFEADAWIAAGRRAEFTTCIMNAGYSSGWCEESFGIQLVATEILCRGRGDDVCRFVMAHPDRIEERVARHRARATAVGHEAGPQPIPDFFARKRLEDELRRARDDLERRVDERTEELRLAHQKLQREMVEREAVERQLRQAQKLEALGRLAGGIAHDFNNLLTAIQGYAELIVDEGAPEPHHGFGREIVRAADQAARLTRQLLVFSRQQVMVRRTIDLALTVRRISDMLRRLIGEDVTLKDELPSTTHPIDADDGQLEQVVVNLAVNARDAMPDGGTLTVTVQSVELDANDAAPLGVAAGPYELLRVADGGHGMPAETVTHVFDPFFTTKPTGQGTGLGLSTVYGIVQQCGGAITVRSEPGRGTTFDLYFPRSSEPVRSSPEELPRGEAPGLVGVILVIEDEAAVREFVQLVLERHGHRVLAAASGDEAEVLFDRYGDEIDLVLTDIILPGASGPEITLRFLDRRKDLPVLYMSGYTDAELERHGVRSSDRSFLQKPFSIEALLELVHTTLQATR